MGVLLAITVQKYCGLSICSTREFCVGFKAAQKATLLSERVRMHVSYTRSSVNTPSCWVKGPCTKVWFLLQRLQACLRLRSPWNTVHPECCSQEYPRDIIYNSILPCFTSQSVSENQRQSFLFFFPFPLFLTLSSSRKGKHKVSQDSQKPLSLAGAKNHCACYINS